MSITVLVPTFNESGNVAELVSRVTAVAVAADVQEILFVDDSTDDTPAVIAQVASTAALPVRLIHRSGEARTGGLSGAVVTGLRAAVGEWVLVMDGDLQHPPEDLPRLARERGGSDIVVASRYRDGGDAAGLSSGRRRFVSSAATQLASLVFPRRLRDCTDPMTGFFAVRRRAVDIDALHPQGFKILLEILARNRLRVVEIPFTFAQRFSGASKASMTQGMCFVRQLFALRLVTLGRVFANDARNPWGQQARFGAVGLVNLVVDVGIFNLLLLTLGKPLTAKLVASSVAIGSSYLLNRRWTWRHRAGRGVAVALPAFVAVALLGVAVAELCLLTSHYLFGLESTLADNVSANVIGLGLGMLVRYRLCDRWVFRSEQDVLLDLTTAGSAAPAASSGPASEHGDPRRRWATAGGPG